MRFAKITLIQLVNLALLAGLSLFALESWWKIFLFGLIVILITSALAFRYEASEMALAVGSLPIAWVAGMALSVVASLLGFRLG